MKRKEIQKKILIISGEASGDANAAQLINALKKKSTSIRFFVTGGEKCRKTGAEVIYDIQNLGIVGFKAAIQKLPQILKLRRAINNCIKNVKPDLVIPVDFPDFNISMLKKYHGKGIPILYFISPQIWIWRKNRIYKLKKYIKRILVLLPFEVDLYRSKGIDAVYIGNPAVDRVKVTMRPEEFRKKNHIPPHKPIITFLPGSRFHEIEDFLPIIIESIKLLKNNGDYQFIITPADSVNAKRCEEVIKKKGLSDYVLLLPAEAYNAASASMLVITKSGTSTIEMALIGVPFIVVYKTTFLAYHFIRMFYKKKEVSLVNIIGDGNLVPELIQSDFTPSKICDTAINILSDSKKRSEILRYLKKIRERLGQPGAAERAAESVLEILG